MPQRITNVAITLHREGQRIDINAGTLYNFTKEELEQLKSLNPDAVRLPRNESVVIDHNADNADNGGQQISDGGANSGDDNNTDGTKTVKAAKQAGAAKSDKKKDDAKAVKEEGSDPAEDGEL
ncbi:DUF7443 domain-containing protein [Enterobacter hormaechei]|uniref:DUF7443 domain-containing protein n=1 Tax=Enterobacter hormaechei TaxID=158836 RepID=UPI003D36D11D